MPLLGWSRVQLVGSEELPALERFARQLYATRARRLGWEARAEESGEESLLRRELLSFLAFTARDAAVRREAATRGRRLVGFGGDGALHPEAVHAPLAGLALTVAVQEGDAAFFEHLLGHLRRSEDALFRGRALGALGSTKDPALAQRALALSLDPALRVNEVTEPLGPQLSMPETREQAWRWLQDHFDGVFARVASTRGGAAPWLVRGFCSEERAREIEAFFAPRVGALPGGPRNLQGSLEAIRLCAARVEAQRPSARAFLSRR
jgi:alanyl aminopeptidase